MILLEVGVWPFWKFIEGKLYEFQYDVDKINKEGRFELKCNENGDPVGGEITDSGPIEIIGKLISIAKKNGSSEKNSF